MLIGSCAGLIVNYFSPIAAAYKPFVLDKSGFNSVRVCQQIRGSVYNNNITSIITTDR